MAGSAAEWIVGWGVRGRPIIIRMMLEAGLRLNVLALRHHCNNIEASSLLINLGRNKQDLLYFHQICGLYRFAGRERKHVRLRVEGNRGM